MTGPIRKYTKQKKMGEPLAKKPKKTEQQHADELYDACHCGNFEMARAALAAGANASPPWGERPPIVAAAASGDVRIVRMLLDAGADADSKLPSCNRNALHNVEGPHGAEIVNMLVDAGACLDALDEDGMSPLLCHMWAEDDHVIAEALLKCGANPNLASACGRTPLMAAILNARRGAAAAGSRQIQLLLSYHADPNLQSTDRCGYRTKATPLTTAVRRGNPIEDVAALLDAGADVNGKDEHGGCTPLIAAAVARRLDVMRMLVDRGADRRATCDVGGDARAWSNPFGYGEDADKFPASAKFLEDLDKRDAATLCRATHPRLGCDSPASLLAGFPEIAAFIVFHAFGGSGREPELP